MVERLRRALAHLFTPPARLRRLLSEMDSRSIADAIARSERKHRGEICVVVEPALDLGDVFRGVTTRERALQLFSAKRVWDTEENNGVLIYFLLADRALEIVADRGVVRHWNSRDWEQLSREIEQQIREQGLRSAIIHGIQKLGVLLTTYYPSRENDRNEIPDTVVMT